MSIPEAGRAARYRDEVVRRVTARAGNSAVLRRFFVAHRLQSAAMTLLGHTFMPGDELGESVAFVSEGFWLRRLGGDPAAVGRTITLDGSPHLVVGVVPRDFRFSSGELEFVPTTWPADPMVALRAEC
jgi:hypothetical protein